MSLATFLHRVGRTRWDERLMLAEAVIRLAGAALAIRLFPFKWVMRNAGLARSGAIRENGNSFDAAEKASWAIKAAAPYVPWKTACFQTGLALHKMLRRRGIASFLHYGVGQSGEKGLSAHVWVTVEGKILIGEEEAGSHACLVTFPANAGSS